MEAELAALAVHPRQVKGACELRCICDVTLSRRSQVLLTQNDRVIQAISSNRANDSFCIHILPGRSRRRQHFAQPNPFDLPAREC